MEIVDGIGYVLLRRYFGELYIIKRVTDELRVGRSVVKFRAPRWVFVKIWFSDARNELIFFFYFYFGFIDDL